MTNFNPQLLSQLDRSRISDYKANLDFYNGEQWTEKSDPSRRRRQLVFNYAKIAVDKLTSYLTEGLNFACEPVEATDKAKELARAAEKVIYDVYNQNNLQELDYETEVDAAILGDGCYKVTWDTGEKRIRVTSPDVNGLYAWWLGDDLSKVWRVASRYTLTQEEVDQLYQRKTDKKTVTITEVWTDQAVHPLSGQRHARGQAQPLRLYPLCYLPQPTAAQALLGYFRYTTAKAGAERA